MSPWATFRLSEFGCDTSIMHFKNRVWRFFERHKDRVLWSLILVMVGTWSHFSDPPSGFSGTVSREEPRLVFSPQTRTRDFSFFLILYLLFRFFVYLLVFILAVVVGVFLFVRCFASACKWRMLWSHGRTTTLLLLILAIDSTKIRPAYNGMSTPSLYLAADSLPECGEFAITTLFTDIRRMEVPCIHSMLLDMVEVAR